MASSEVVLAGAVPLVMLSGAAEFLGSPVGKGTGRLEARGQGGWRPVDRAWFEGQRRSQHRIYTSDMLGATSVSGDKNQVDTDFSLCGKSAHGDTVRLEEDSCFYTCCDPPMQIKASPRKDTQYNLLSIERQSNPNKQYITW